MRRRGADLGQTLALLFSLSIPSFRMRGSVMVLLGRGKKEVATFGRADRSPDILRARHRRARNERYLPGRVPVKSFDLVRPLFSADSSETRSLDEAVPRETNSSGDYNARRLPL